MLRQVGQDQPPLAARLQMLRQRRQKSTQHPAVGIVDSVFHGRARPRGNPGRVADHERRAAFGKRSACTTSTRSESPSCRTFSRAHASARGSRSVATTRSMPRRASTAASTPVPVPMSNATLDEAHAAGKRRRADEVHVLTADRREDAEVRMNPAARLRNLDALRAPLVRTDHAEQRSQRGDRCRLRGTERLRAGLPDIGRPSQRDRVVVVERNQQRVERARPLRPAPAGRDGMRRPE